MTIRVMKHDEKGRRYDGYLNLALPLFHPTSIQAEDPPGPSDNLTYINQPGRNEDVRTPTTHQMVGPHLRLKTLIQTTHSTFGKPRSSSSRMHANAREHEGRPEPPEHEDPI